MAGHTTPIVLAVSGLSPRGLACSRHPPASSYADHAPHSAYHFPNDEPELDRLNNQHDIIKILLDGRNYLAPLSHDNPPRKILDIATGTGRWAIEMGDEFPLTSVIGTDLSPVQPEIVPPNVRFYIDDGCVCPLLPRVAEPVVSRENSVKVAPTLTSPLPSILQQRRMAARRKLARH